MSLQHTNTAEFEFGEVGRTMPRYPNRHDLAQPLTLMALGLHYLARAVGEITVQLDRNYAELVKIANSTGRGQMAARGPLGM